MKHVSIYTDGACSGNPGSGGWGALIIYDSIEKELSGHEDSTTNNRMELMSAIMALEKLKEPCLVELYSDSKYLIDGITKWINRWEKNNWLSTDKKPVKNQDLWTRLRETSKRHTISWHWVEGHSGYEFNERVDKLARSLCKASSD
ncbi:MAG: ribonuclease HI [Holosporaceae bacterium]|jgi:ribonuclease HI|nr:ribonuclease HI [Holosporaceae bacterium]